jgi:pyruvate kinase
MPTSSSDRDFLDRTFTRVDQSIAMAALFTALPPQGEGDRGADAIAAPPRCGCARLDCGVPIYALTPQGGDPAHSWRCYRDVRRCIIDTRAATASTLLHEAEAILLADGVVSAAGDLIVLTIGEPIGKSGRHQHAEDRPRRRALSLKPARVRKV